MCRCVVRVGDGSWGRIGGNATPAAGAADPQGVWWLSELLRGVASGAFPRPGEPAARCHLFGKVVSRFEQNSGVLNSVAPREERRGTSATSGVVPPSAAKRAPARTCWPRGTELPCPSIGRRPRVPCRSTGRHCINFDVIMRQIPHQNEDDPVALARRPLHPMKTLQKCHFGLLMYRMHHSS